MKHIVLCSTFFVTQEISIPVASRVGAEMFIEGQISSLIVNYLGAGKCPEEDLFPASLLEFFYL